MKKKILSFILLLTSLITAAQIKVQNGPGLDNDEDSKMNRMLIGDDNSFYCYRVRSKGKGTSFFVEKYDKATLKPVFSKEINFDQTRLSKIEDVEYAQGNVYMFTRVYNKDEDKMTLFYQTVSSSGEISKTPKEILNVNSDHYEFVDIDISLNPSKTKFLVKISHKKNKEDDYKTDFTLLDIIGMKQLWTKRVDRRLFTTPSALNSILKGMLGTLGKYINLNSDFIGLSIDDADNIYYAFNYHAKNSIEKEEHYKLALGILNEKSTTEQLIQLAFDDDYLVKDVEFSKTKNDQLAIGGFYKDVIERKGRDLVKVGVFSFTIDLTKNIVLSKAAKSFDGKMLVALESSPKKSRYFKYKLDYILPIGNDVFYVGEQYDEQMRTSSNGAGAYGGTSGNSTYWEYEYMDVIIAKLNSNGEFEWIKNTPLRNRMQLQSPHVFKQYIAIPTPNSVYILNNENEKNLEIYNRASFEPEDIKSVSKIHGSNFVASEVSTKDGSIKHSLIFKNETYCFAPIQERNFSFMPPSDTEIFVPGKANEIYIYTEDRGKDRFTKLVIP